MIIISNLKKPLYKAVFLFKIGLKIKQINHLLQRQLFRL